MKSVLAYPLVVLLVLLAWMVFVFSVLVPPLAEIYGDFGIELPPTTKVVIWLSGPGKWLVFGPLLAAILAP